MPSNGFGAATAGGGALSASRARGRKPNSPAARQTRAASRWVVPNSRCATPTPNRPATVKSSFARRRTASSHCVRTTTSSFSSASSTHCSCRGGCARTQHHARRCASSKCSEVQARCPFVGTVSRSHASSTVGPRPPGRRSSRIPSAASMFQPGTIRASTAQTNSQPKTERLRCHCRWTAAALN